MAMENKRIIQLSTERTNLTSGDYVMVDSDEEGSAKYRLDRLKETDNTLSVSGKAADAAATGQAIGDEATARGNAVAAEAEARAAAVTAEAQARAAADTTLGNDVDDLKSALKKEFDFIDDKVGYNSALWLKTLTEPTHIFNSQSKTEYIAEANTKIHVLVDGDGFTASTATLYFWYDGASSATSKGNINIGQEKVFIESNKVVALGIYRDNTGTQAGSVWFIAYNETGDGLLNDIHKNIEQNIELTNRAFREQNKAISPVWVNQDVNNSTGEMSGANSKKACTEELIPVIGYKKVSLSSTTPFATSAFLIYCFDANNSYIGAYYRENFSEFLIEDDATSYVRLLISSSQDFNAENYDGIVHLKTETNENDIQSKNILPDLYHATTLAPLRIKLLGDSITAGVGGTGYAEDGDTIPNSGGNKMNPNGYCWANLFKSYVEDKFACSVVNYAISGKNSSFYSDRASTMIETTDDIVICMLGTNDRDTSDYQAIDTTYDNLEILFNRAKSVGAKFIPMANIPADLANETWHLAHMEDVAHIVNAFSSDNKLEFVDVFRKMQELCEYTGNALSTYLDSGSLHPNDSGYFVMFKIIARELGIDVKIDNADW